MPKNGWKWNSWLAILYILSAAHKWIVPASHFQIGQLAHAKSTILPSGMYW